MRTAPTTLLVLAVLSQAAMALPAAAGVLKVAPSGGTHTDLQAALDDAADGDIVLMDTALVFGPGAPPVHLTGKGLTLVGDGATRAQMPVTIVEGVPAGSTLVLRNLAFQPGPVDPIFGGLLDLRSCAGTVLVEDCAADGEDIFGVDGGKGGPGLSVSGCDAVSLVRSRVTGGDGNSPGEQPPGTSSFAGHGGRALRVSGSRVVVHDTLVAGGDGGDGLGSSNGGGGALGLDSQNGDLWLVGATVAGGEGGAGSPPGTPSFGAQIDGFVSHLRELDTSFVGGGAFPGLALISGSHTVWGGAAVTVGITGPARPGDAVSLGVSGPPGTLFGFFCDLDPAFLPVVEAKGVLQLEALGPALFFATIPPGGTFVLDTAAPTVPGLDGFVKRGQAVSDQGAAGLVLSNVTAYVQVQGGL